MKYMIIVLTCLTFMFTGCVKKTKPTYYEIPKSEIVENTPKPVASATPATVSENPTPIPSATPATVSENTTPMPGATPEKGIDDDSNEYDVDEYPDPINLLHSYAYALVDAINSGDFSLVEEYLLEGSSLYYAQKALVNNLFSYGTTEKMESIEIIAENWESPYKCFVSTREVATIYYKSGKEETNTYYWTYTMVRKDDKYYLSDIKKYEN